MKIFLNISLLILMSLPAIASVIRLSNQRYDLDFSTISNSYDLKEKSSGVVRTFTPTFYMIYRSTKPSLSLLNISEDFNYKTVAFGGSSTLFSPNAGAFTLRGTPVSVTENDGLISIVYQDNDNYQLSATISLPSGNEEPLVESSLKSLKSGYFSVGFYGSPELDRNEVSEIFQPLPFTGLRVPSTSYLTPAFLATLPATFLTVGAITYGVYADPDEFPFSPLPNRLSRSPFGVALKNREGFGKELKPMVWAPIIGNDDSYMQANQTKTFRFRPYVTMGSITKAYEDIARRQFGFGNFRHNDLGNLNKTLHRMIDYAMTTQWGVFKEELKGSSYDTDVPNSVKNTSSLPMYAAAFIADRQDVYEKRAQPVLEFLLSRENTMYADEETGGAGGQTATNTLGKPSMNYSEMLSYYSITNKRMEAMLSLANANKKGAVLSGEIALKENFSLYKATGQTTTYADLISGTNSYISQEIKSKPVGFDYTNHQKNSFWSSIAPKYVELYEIYKATGNDEFLAAARNSARIFAYHLWMSPKVVPGDSLLVNIGNKAPRYRGTGNISIPEEKVPMWRLSEMGLHCEAGGTSTSGHRAVFTANSAGYLLRIGSLTKDTFLMDIAKAAVIGRYTNFPGYHINTDRTSVYEKPEFPLRTLAQLTSTSMHYSHIWPQINLIYDYLVSDVAVRTKGAVDFPGYYVQNIVHMQNQVYTTGGSFYGESDINLWMPAELMEVSDEQLNYISAHGNGKLYLVFTNQSGKEVAASVRLNPSLVEMSGSNYSFWTDNSPGTGGTIAGNQLSIRVSPHGVTAVAIDKVKVNSRFQQKLLKNTKRNTWNKYQEPNIPIAMCKSFLLNPSDSLAQLFVFSADPKGTHANVKLQYSLDEGAWSELTDSSYPFEFSVAVGTASSVRYKVIANGQSSPVYVYERLKPSAIMSGWTTTNTEKGATLRVDFTGESPFELQYAENGKTIAVKEIYDSIYTFQVFPKQNTTYQIVTMRDATGVDGNVSGDAKVVVVDAYVPLQTSKATKDAQTYKSQSTRNFGTDQQLELKGSSTFRRDLYYSFTIPALNLIDEQRAFIYVWINETSRLDQPWLTKHIKLTRFENSWDELAITWNNQPVMTGGEVLDTVAVSSITTVPGWMVFDITRLINRSFTGELNVKAEYLKGEEVASVYVASRENATTAYHPHFAVVETQGVSASEVVVNDGFEVYPSLFDNFLIIKGNVLPMEVCLYDSAGKMIRIKNSSGEINTTHVPPGLYQLVMWGENNDLYRYKLLKK